MGAVGPPKISRYKCGQPAQLMAEKVVREAVGGFVFQVIVTGRDGDGSTAVPKVTKNRSIMQTGASISDVPPSAAPVFE